MTGRVMVTRSRLILLLMMCQLAVVTAGVPMAESAESHGISAQNASAVVLVLDGPVKDLPEHHDTPSQNPNIMTRPVKTSRL